MKRYRVVEDLQGGGWCVGCVDTAEGWLERATDWRDSDGWEDDERERFVKFWKRMIKDGREQELIDYIADVWSLEIKEID